MPLGKNSNKTYIGFYADADVVKRIKERNDEIYRKTGKTNQSQAVNELIRGKKKEDADNV